MPKIPRALFLGSDRMQDQSGMLQALSRRASVTEFTRADGSYGIAPAPARDSMEVYRPNTERLRQIMELSGRDGAFDLVIGQMWGIGFDARVLSDFRKNMGSRVVAIAMDDRHAFWLDSRSRRWMGSSGMIGHLDLALTAAPEAVEWYRKEGCHAAFFPEASDPEIFSAYAGSPKRYDVCFVGAKYGVRRRIVDALRKANISVSVFGAGWNEGRLSSAEVPRLFAESRIVLGVGTVGYCDDFYALKLRDFDAPMSGSFYLTHDNKDLDLVYDVGTEMETYRNIDECVEKVQFYLKNDAGRESIAQAGYLRARRDHTWNRRFERLFDLLGGGLQLADFHAW